MVIVWPGSGWAVSGKAVLVRLDYGGFVGLMGPVDLVRYCCCSAILVWRLRLVVPVLFVLLQFGLRFPLAGCHSRGY
jgi:hypothetical protein